MNVKTISKFLIFIGIGIIFVAMVMDTSVSTGYGRVHNIGLVSQQQNLLIFGGIAFLAGVVLFSTVKLKQTPQEAEAENDERRQQVERAEEAVNSLATDTASLIQSWWAGLDNIPGRIGVYVFVGLISATVMGLLIWGLSGMKWTLAEVVYGAFFIGAALYSCRPAPAVKVMTHLLIANVAAFTLIGLVAIIQYLGANGDLNLNPAFISLFFILVSMGFVQLINYLEQRRVDRIDASSRH